MAGLLAHVAISSSPQTGGGFDKYLAESMSEGQHSPGRLRRGTAWQIKEREKHDLSDDDSSGDDTDDLSEDEGQMNKEAMLQIEKVRELLRLSRGQQAKGALEERAAMVAALASSGLSQFQAQRAVTKYEGGVSKTKVHRNSPVHFAAATGDVLGCVELLEKDVSVFWDKRKERGGWKVPMGRYFDDLAQLVCVVWCDSVPLSYCDLA